MQTERTGQNEQIMQTERTGQNEQMEQIELIKQEVEALKWERLLKKENMLILVLLGVLLFIIAIPIDGKEETQTEAKQNTQESSLITSDVSATEDTFTYCYVLEDRIEKLLSCMEGVGEVEVMVTVKASGEKIVEKDEPVTRNTVTERDGNGGSRSTNDSAFSYETIYETDREGSKTPYVVQETEPEIEGITVVAKGGGNSVVQKNISDALIALFHIEAHKIKVVKMK